MNSANGIAQVIAADDRAAAGHRPLTGNEAIARGAWEAGVRVAAAYPGTPSTEILEALATYPVQDVHAQWSPNEKVALDVAIGASFAGVRALAIMKHVGLNVAADALMSQSYIGAHGALVLVVCDDPGIHSSQNEQDTRLLGRFASVPVLEPSDGQEALEFTRLAFEMSERFDTPVIVRSTTRLSHTRSNVRLGARVEAARRGFSAVPSKNVMIPAHARARHPRLLDRERSVGDYVAASAMLSRREHGDRRVGVITLSTAYTYVKEVLPDASILKLGASWPLPPEPLREFCASVERLFVVEELEPVIENDVRALGFAVEGKRYFSRLGELSPESVRQGFTDAGILEPRVTSGSWAPQPLLRPPVLCAGCPHMTSYLAVRACDAHVAGDIGCYSLAVLDPLRGMDTCVAMGSSIGNAVGMAKAGTDKPVVATIGDSTFLHSGIAPLIDAVYNRANITVVILDNHTVAMTGGQDHPGTGKTLRGEATHKIDYEALCRALGVQWLRTVDSYDVAAMHQTLREAIAYKGPSVVISNRPCVLDPVKIKGEPFRVIEAECNACQACMNLGCPALTWSDGWHEAHHKVKIDQTACIGCSLCAQVCTMNCIQPAALR